MGVRGRGCIESTDSIGSVNPIFVGGEGDYEPLVFPKLVFAHPFDVARSGTEGRRGNAIRDGSEDDGKHERHYTPLRRLVDEETWFGRERGK